MFYDPGRNRMPGLGPDRSNQRALRIQPHSETPFVLHPKDVIKAVAQFDRLVENPFGSVFLAQPPQQLGDTNLGGKNERLELAERDWILYLTSVWINDGIARVFPGLILQSLLGASLVGIKAIVARRAVIEPFQALDRGLEKRPHEVEVPGPVPKIGQHDRVKARPGQCAVIPGERVIVERRHRTGVDLVDESAWFLIAPIILFRRLSPGKFRQSAAHHFIAEKGALPSRGQRIAAKEGKIIRHAGG